MLHDEAENDLVLPLELQLVGDYGSATDFNAVTGHKKVRRLLALVNILVMPHILEQELLVVVGLLLVDIEINAVEVEQTVRQLVAGERAHDQLGLVSVEHAAAREVALSRCGSPCCLLA